MRTALAIAVGTLILASAPYWTTQAIVFLIGLTLIDAVFALSWNLLFGFTGLTTFGHAAFFAVGAYATGVALKMHAPVHFLLLLGGVTLLGAVLSLLVGLVVLRRAAGIALAILTMALGEILHIIIGYSVALGREDGMSGIPRPSMDLLLTRLDLQAGNNYYWFLCVICALIAGVLCWLTFGRFGRVLRSIQQDPERTAFLGVNVARYRLASFTIAGGVAALAGALYTPWVQTITPDLADTFRSAQPMLNALLGGAQSFWGPVVGTAVFAIVNFSTRTLAGLSELVVGGVLLVVILVAPTGLMGLVDKLRRRGGPEAPPGAKSAPTSVPASGAAAPAPGVAAAPLDSKEGQ
jgi:branched-chain amino acid transport system permease protein